MDSGSSRKFFVNLAVESLSRSVDFFTQLGFAFDPRFSDETATCMIVNDEAFVMVLVKDRFKDFTTRELCDPATHTEAIMTLSAGSREQVDEFVRKALAVGGRPANDPMDMGTMYGWSFLDPDGHLWEVIWVDASLLDQGERQKQGAIAS